MSMGRASIHMRLSPIALADRPIAAYIIIVRIANAADAESYNISFPPSAPATMPTTALIQNTARDKLSVVSQNLTEAG